MGIKWKGSPSSLGVLLGMSQLTFSMFTAHCGLGELVAGRGISRLIFALECLNAGWSGGCVLPTTGRFSATSPD